MEVDSERHRQDSSPRQVAFCEDMKWSLICYDEGIYYNKTSTVKAVPLSQLSPIFALLEVHLIFFSKRV